MVVPIDKLSILVTIAFSYVVFHEKLTAKAGIGLVLIVAGRCCCCSGELNFQDMKKAAEFRGEPAILKLWTKETGTHH